MHVFPQMFLTAYVAFTIAHTHFVYTKIKYIFDAHLAYVLQDLFVIASLFHMFTK